MTTSWDVELAERVGKAVKRLREQETPKLSAARLAERTEKCGYTMTKAQVSDLELGRKKTITVPELITLALALGVPPVQLLYPELPDGPVSIWPDTVCPSVEALQWFSGDISAREVVDNYVTAGSTNVRVRESREYVRLTNLRKRAARERMISQLIPGDAEWTADHALSVLREAQERIDELKKQFTERGWPVDDA
ncbi:helix-turn-helix domain-containing protein [Nocardia sp. NPDC050799]|uniref:helix-turn-helix domain-containing protein n=1 Tax=Nocardia sp. NPDC050799 TaxID=3154842 RepID=UPI003410CAD0